MSEIILDSKDIEQKILYSEKLEINQEDLQHIYCDGKNCNPTICLRTSCKVHEYWRGKND